MNRGAVALGELLASRGAKALLAREMRELGVDPPKVSHWLHGKLRPNTRQRAYIEDRYGVNWRLWDEELKPRKRRSVAVQP